VKIKQVSKNRRTSVHITQRAGVVMIVLALAAMVPGLATGNAPDVALGPPGTVFRSEQTLGQTGIPYLADTAHLYSPVGIGTDAAGNLWVAEGYGARALKYSGSGTFLLSVGTPGLVYLADETHLAGPADIALDSAGNFWVADANAHRVVKFDASGNYLMQLGVTWETGADEDHFDQSSGLAVDSADNLYVSDFNNHGLVPYPVILTGDICGCGRPTAEKKSAAPRFIQIDSSPLHGTGALVGAARFDIEILHQRRQRTATGNLGEQGRIWQCD
jgi:hypothetical protein